MPERYTDEELRAIAGCSWRLDERAPAPSIEVQRAVHDKARAELGARGEAVSALNGLLYHHLTDGDLTNAWTRARRAVAALGYALPDPRRGGPNGEQGEEGGGAQGRQDEAERAARQGHGAGAAAGSMIHAHLGCSAPPALCCGDPRHCTGARSLHP